jgi:hypothetical protein
MSFPNFASRGGPAYTFLRRSANVAQAWLRLAGGV